MEPLLISGIKKINDVRGCFYESFKKSLLEQEYGFTKNFVQDNHSISRKNTIRGMHYQWNGPMGKLIRVAKGAILDVVVDIRKKSRNFGNVYYYHLDDENLDQLYVPPGFAHGFLSKSDESIVIYKCTEEYNKNGESGINPFDKTLDIQWGLSYKEAIVSEKDANAKTFQQYIREHKF